MTTVIAADGSTIETTDFYDSNGNPTGSALMIYNAEGQLTSWVSYNAAGQQTGGSDDGDNSGGDTGNGDAGGGGGGGDDDNGDGDDNGGDHELQ